MKKSLILFLMLALLTGCAPSKIQEPADGKLHIDDLLRHVKLLALVLDGKKRS